MTYLKIVSTQASKGELLAAIKTRLSRCLKPAPILELLRSQTSLFAASDTVLDCQLISAKFKPEFDSTKLATSGFFALYEIKFSNGYTKAVKAVRIFCDILSAEVATPLVATNADEATDKGPTKGSTKGSTKPLLEHSEDGISLRAWLFPHDPTLRQLPELLDPKQVKAELQAAGIEVWQGLEIQVVDYQPTHRCTLWHHLLDAHGRISQSLFAKTYADERFATIYQLLQDLDAQKSLLIPRPLTISHSFKTIWLEQLKGQPLIEHLTEGTHQLLLERAARELAKLNQLEVTARTRTSHPGKLAEAQKKLRKLALILPNLALQIQRFSGVLEWKLPQHAPQRLIHGDLHLRQFLCHQGRISLLDYDACGKGDPHEDLAHFIADLHSSGYPEAFCIRLTETFLSAYRAALDFQISKTTLDWHLACEYLNRAYRLFSRPENCETEMTRLIAQAEKILLSGSTFHSSTGVNR